MDEFIKKYNGTSVDFDHTAGSQCVDLAKLWLDYLGYDASGTWGNGKDWDKNDGRQGLRWIANTPTGLPQQGDLIVWGNGTYGHVAVFIDGDLLNFRSFDQNYPVGSVCKIVNHTYANVKGWLRTNYIETVVEKDAIQFEGDTRVYFWAQNPDVASAWYGSDWGKYVRIIKPQIVKEEVIKEVIKEVEKIVEVEVPKEIIKEIIVQAQLSDEEGKVLSIWQKIKNFLQSLRKN